MSPQRPRRRSFKLARSRCQCSSWNTTRGPPRIAAVSDWLWQLHHQAPCIATRDTSVSSAKGETMFEHARLIDHDKGGRLIGSAAPPTKEGVVLARLSVEVRILGPRTQLIECKRPMAGASSLRTQMGVLLGTPERARARRQRPCRPCAPFSERFSRDKILGREGPRASSASASSEPLRADRTDATLHPTWLRCLALLRHKGSPGV